ncbi:protein kinase domain-containing protein [Streptomyces parvus]|uniref:protein kinase domain-containing protein n=1 Tax=Streptomyces parvus TaxID=66428 RepID=UPI0030B8F5E9
MGNRRTPRLRHLHHRVRRTPHPRHPPNRRPQVLAHPHPHPPPPRPPPRPDPPRGRTPPPPPLPPADPPVRHPHRPRPPTPTTPRRHRLVLERADSCLHTTTTPPTSPDATLTQICEGLTHLHEAGWIHGDLKPANILVMADGTIRLADFNTAARLEGTHAYAPPFTSRDHTPPEQLWPEMDERGTRTQPSVDVWAFGILAHTLLTGTHPLPGATTAARCDAATRYARGTQQLHLSTTLPPTWQKIIRDSLARTPTDRPDTHTLLTRVRHASHHR